MINFSKLPWLKITGWAVLLHVILIVLSIIEVFIYSLVNSGHEHSFYEEHAKFSGPYISIFFGFILFYFVVRFLSKKIIDKKWGIALSLPIIYTIMDFLMVHFAGVDWSEHFMIFMVSFLVKMTGAFLGAYAIKEKIN